MQSDFSRLTMWALICGFNLLLGIMFGVDELILVGGVVGAIICLGLIIMPWDANEKE